MDTIKIDKKETRLIAHRGLSGIEMENTCSAFVAAGNRSYWGIETDVHKTSDGKFVVFHDDTTGRVAMDDMVVENTTYETLRKLQLTDRDGLRGRSDLLIPSLEEYIAICKKYDKIAVLELKNRFSEDDIYQIVDIIKDMGYLKHTIFISFVLENLTVLKERYPTQTAQYLVSDFHSSVIYTLRKYNLDLDILYTELNADNVKLLHDNGIKINCWTCDDPAFAAKMTEWGVDMITSNILE